MAEQDLIHKIEWVNKRCSLKGEPLTQIQIELLKFVFAGVSGRSEQCCSPTDGFYLGTTCPNCKKPFRKDIK